MKKNRGSQSGAFNRRVIAAFALCSLGASVAMLSFAQSPTPTPAPAPTVQPGVPRYQNYVSPKGLGDDSGEPSIGVNWNSEKIFNDSVGAIPNGGTAMYYGGFAQALRITFSDCPSPASPKWEDVTPLLPSSPRAVGDPILFTDHQTGRTFVTQLEGLTPFSTTEFTDNDGATYQISQGSGIASGFDHETVGGGPFAPGLQGTTSYKNAVYYCSQAVADANCALSLDGGQTFGPAVPIFTRVDCVGLHGHVKVAPDGTVYVPNKACGGTPIKRTNEGLVVSKDNGLTWTVRAVQGTRADGSAFTSSPGNTDPSVGVASDGTVYFGYQNDEFDANGNPLRTTAHIAVSHDKGRTWINDNDVGAALGIQNVVFPAVVSGDSGRAAFAFFGTTTGGDYQATTNFNANPPTGFVGTWYLFAASTFDGGKTWTTVNATPSDPIQRGSICTGGTTCGNDRNLLDFFDASVDKEGRVLVGYDDGCVSTLCINGGPNDFTAKATIARQSGGKRLFAQFDPVEPQAPAAPRLEHIFRNSSGVELVWSEPDNGGSPITSYNIFRGTTSGGETLLASVSNASFYDPTLESSTITYGDITADPTTTYFYTVSAVNAQGQGALCGEINTVGAPAPPASPVALCDGTNVVTDPSGDATNPLGINDSSLDQVDIVGVSFSSDAVAKTLTTTLTLKNLTSPPIPITGTTDTFYWVAWTGPNGKVYATRASEPDPTGAVAFRYGQFDPGNNAFISSTATTGSITPRPNGTISVNVPLSAIGNPTIPAAQGGTPAVTRPYALTVSGFGAAGSGLRFIASDDRAPNTGFGADWSVCPAIIPSQDTPPTAALSANPISGNAPLTVNFDASGSRDVDGDSIASYTFDFGDGSAPVTQLSPSISHTYSTAANYVARLTVTDSRGTKSINNASKFISVIPQCLEDDDPHIAYDNGWHTIQDSNASAGHFHLDTGKDVQHALKFTFQLQSDMGTLQYFFAKSTKGGTTQVLIDGKAPMSNGIVNYQATAGTAGSGSMHDPFFKDTTGKLFSVTYSFTGKGFHTFELVNLNGPAYVDEFCITNATSSTMATAGPGTTMTSTSALAIGQSLLQNVMVPSNALGFSVAAEANLNAPYTLVVIDPSGKVLGTVNSSSNGIASVTMPVSTSGLYVIQLVNVGVGPVNIWTAATPFVQW